MKRRDFVKNIPLGLAAASVPFSIGGFSGTAFGKSALLDALLNVQSNTDRVLVLINLQGGNDGLNTIIPFTDPLYYQNRPDIGYTKSAGDQAKLTATKLSDTLSLNPSMTLKTDGKTATNFLNLYSAGKLAVLNSVGYDNPNRSHFRATDIWNSASDSDLVISTGWVARYLEDQRANVDLTDPPAIAINTATTLVFQGDSAVQAIAVSDPSHYTSATNYTDDTPPANNYGAEVSFVREILAQSDTYGARFKSIFSQSGATTNTVPYSTSNPLAQQLQKVAWCIKAGMKTRVYFVSLGSFDTHINQYTTDPTTPGQGYLLSQLAEAIATFQQDIENMGVADRVIGMTYSEFGRRVNQNGSHGTDHGTCAPMFVFGTNINGGKLYGPDPSLKPANLDLYGDLVRFFDFRQVYASILTQWFGANDAFRKAVLVSNGTQNFVDSTTATPDFTYQFQLNGSGTMTNLITSPANSVPMTPAANFVLYQNAPNPVQNETTIRFDLASGSNVTMELFDSRGSLIRTLASGYHGAGQYSVTLDAGNLASGTYYYRLEAGGAVQSRALVLVR